MRRKRVPFYAKETFHLEQCISFPIIRMSITITILDVIHHPVFYLKHNVINPIGVVASVQRQRLGLSIGLS
jgi:hypothetical protein